MNSTANFDSTKQHLHEILDDIGEGETQLPDFQRSWIWDDEHIRSLLASISLSYPIGAVMLLETGNEEVQFKPRLVAGVEELETGSLPKTPELLILDGQQRLTALFLALRSRMAVPTTDARKKHTKRWYYIDMKAALNPQADREEAILSLPEDKKVRNFRGELLGDYSTPEKEFEALIFPLCEVFDCSDWRLSFNEYWDYEKEQARFFDGFEKQVVERFKQYQVPLIQLGQATPKEAVCQVFEKVNTAGIALNVFELLTATFAADNYNLRKDWYGEKGFKGRKARLSAQPVLAGLESTDFLQAVTLLSTLKARTADLDSGLEPERARGVTCRRKELLRLPLPSYTSWADQAEEGFKKVARFLHSQYIFSSRDVPYQTQLVPLASILTVGGEKAQKDGNRQKLVQWFWSGVLGELYGSAVESRFAKDLPQVLSWLDGGPEPETVTEASFQASRLLTLRSRQSAAYKGLYALLMRDGALDFQSGEPIIAATYFDERLDIHHIFPKAWCEKHGIDRSYYDSIVNKTAISARTNRIVGGNAPSQYLEKLERTAGIDSERVDEILRSHLIDPEPVRQDDFHAFFAAREDELLTRIASATKKQVDDDRQVTDASMPSDDYEEDELEADELAPFN